MALFTLVETWVYVARSHADAAPPLGGCTGLRRNASLPSDWCTGPSSFLVRDAVCPHEEVANLLCVLSGGAKLVPTQRV